MLTRTSCIHKCIVANAQLNHSYMCLHHPCRNTMLLGFCHQGSKQSTKQWPQPRDVLTERVENALTGSETNTSSGGVSREPSAAAYTTANTKVLSQSTSKTGRQQQVQGVWTEMEINHTNGAQVNYHSRFIFTPLIIQQSIWVNQNSSPSIYKCNIYLWQVPRRCRRGDM